jgi:MoaA/NifB/PqqE/SkfB family radical SAM enzyme
VIDVAIRPHQITIVASLHLTQVQSVDSFVKKCIDLQQYAGNKLSIKVVSVLTNENFELLKKTRAQLTKFHIIMDFQRLKLDKEFCTYSDEVEQYYKDSNFTTKRKTKCNPDNLVGLNPYGYICSAGFRFISIRPNGDIMKCFDRHKTLYKLGNINYGERNIFKSPLPCFGSKCICRLPVLNGLIDFNHRDVKCANKIEHLFGE